MATTHNVGKNSVKGVSTGPQVTLVPAVPVSGAETITRTREALPTSLGYSSNTRIDVPMAQLCRKGHYETIKDFHLRIKCGMRDGNPSASVTGLTMSCHQVLSFISEIKITLDNEPLVEFAANGCPGLFGHMYHDQLLRSFNSPPGNFLRQSKLGEMLNNAQYMTE